MQVISVVHNCLYFKLHGKRYLFGLTHSLAKDAEHTRQLKVNHVVLPSQPYVSSLSLFMWHVPALGVLSCRSLVVADISCKKRMQSVLSESRLEKQQVKWEVMQQHELKQQYLLTVLGEQAVAGPMRQQPNGMGFNEPHTRLNMIVGEKGNSMLLINACNVIIVDPPEGIEQMLQHYGIPLKALKAVLLTDSDNLNIFECLVKLPKVALIAEQAVYAQVKRQLARYFYWNEKMVRSRVSGKVVVEGEKKHRYGNMEYRVHYNLNHQTEYWQVVFGLKLLRIYPRVLVHMPSDLCSNSQLEYCVAYEISQSLRGQLHKLPEVYRKKVIYNRVSRKHNHQYYAQFTPNNPLLFIQAHPYAPSHPPPDHATQLRRHDISAQMEPFILENNQQFNSANRVVYVVSGYVVDEEGKLYGVGSRVVGRKGVRGIKRASILYQPEFNLYFYERSGGLLQKYKQHKQNLLLKVRQNSFVAALAKIITPPLGQVESSSHAEEWFEEGSEWDLVNRASTLKTLESGSNQLVGRQCLYLVIKGCLRLNNNEKLCVKNMGVSKIRSFLQGGLDEGEELEVVKDTWLVEIPLDQLKAGLFAASPQKMYELLSKPMIFT